MLYPIAFSSCPDPQSYPLDIQNSDENSSDASPVRTIARTARTSLVCYGPIRIRRRHAVSSTLATGRRSKDDFIEGEDMVKRELRRMKNREAARRLKAERDEIERVLSSQVVDLEQAEQNLLTEINQLKVYKQKLEDEFDRCLYYYEEALRRNAHAHRREHDDDLRLNPTRPMLIQPKQEPRSTSPQWQLLLQI